VIDDAVLSRNRPSSVLMKDPQWVKMFISGKEGEEGGQAKTVPPPKPKTASPREKKSPQKTPHRTLVFHNTEIGPYSDKMVKQQSKQLAKQAHKSREHRSGSKTVCTKPGVKKGEVEPGIASLHASNQAILHNDTLKCSTEHYQANNREDRSHTETRSRTASHDHSPSIRAEDGRSKQPSGNTKSSPSIPPTVYTDRSPPITAQNSISCSQSQIRPIRSDCTKPIDMSQTDGVT